MLLLFIAGNICAQKADSIPGIHPPIVRSDSAVIAFVSELNIPVTNNNQIKLLKNGTEKFEDLFEAIRGAKHHVHLEYFNFRNDSIANALFDLLSVKVQEGVEVRTLFDDFGNWSNSRPLKTKHLKKIRNKGIEIYHFDKLRFPYINHAFHRDHRKIAIVDGTIAYTGGMNIANYYIKGLPEIGAWRDMHIRIEGSAVKHLQDIFLTMWNKTTKQNIGGNEYYPQPEVPKDSGKIVAIVDRVPKTMPKQMREVYANAIRSAQNKIQIVSPYFLPIKLIKKELKAALKRGVKVEIMLSSKADIPFTPEGSVYVGHKLMKKGAQIYLFNEGFQHAKIMMADDSYCTVGSTNLNSRSLCYDYEVNAFIFDKEITGQLTEIFEKDKNHCTLMTQEEWKKRSAWKRFQGWFATLLTPFL